MMEAPPPPSDGPPRESAAPRTGSLPEDLFALAAGELDASESAAWQARLAEDPALRADFEQIQALDRRLSAEPLLPLPAFLVPRILGASTQIPRAPIRVRPHILLARVAASALIAFASWLAFSGEMPALMDAGAPGRLVASLSSPAFGEALPLSLSLQTDARCVLMAPVPEGASPSLVGTLMLSVVGLLLLVLGLAFARSGHRAAAIHNPKGGQE